MHELASCCTFRWLDSQPFWNVSFLIFVKRVSCPILGMFLPRLLTKASYLHLFCSHDAETKASCQGSAFIVVLCCRYTCSNRFQSLGLFLVDCPDGCEPRKIPSVVARNNDFGPFLLAPLSLLSVLKDMLEVTLESTLEGLCNYFLELALTC